MSVAQHGQFQRLWGRRQVSKRVGVLVAWLLTSCGSAEFQNVSSAPHESPEQHSHVGEGEQQAVARDALQDKVPNGEESAASGTPHASTSDPFKPQQPVPECSGESVWQERDFPADERDLVISEFCEGEDDGQIDEQRKLTVIPVVDVSGSMRPSIESVITGIEQIAHVFQEKGWTLQVGAVAFDDVIHEATPPSSEAHSVLERMRGQTPESQYWRAELGQGTDVPEQGLEALGCALSLLQGSDGCSADGEARLGFIPQQLKPDEAAVGGDWGSIWIIYVSDAPARNIDGTFETRSLEADFRAYAQELGERGSTVRLYHATSNGRLGLLPHWPTPSEQFESFAESAGIWSRSIGFPLTSQEIEETFVADAIQNWTRGEPLLCVLEVLRTCSDGRLLKTTVPFIRPDT